jgi:hypothetical protein
MHRTFAGGGALQPKQQCEAMSHHTVELRPRCSRTQADKPFPAPHDPLSFLTGCQFGLGVERGPSLLLRAVCGILLVPKTERGTS